ncbi:nucleoside-diphosphate kinase [Sulfuracidifex tepidarius]|uniref:Nucleoside diphosphate kinase n=1 Tax=Sulfuracidifex tepidarius TaxID=1294262 RepID=A0A510DWA2_9CREN|nr:nucleoside-diphosphate kinase [Sulfuracidifex tepidarius]BBG24503.1 Nucleoside diphosphate kinase [Sulfuracidifex tepidarius]BBG27260.1 Nucleoside diphosphate kinase [Sulfuracidifex tepidarius]
MEMERTFVMIKPDAVKRNLIGQIISRFELRGLKIIGMKMLKMDRETAEKLYAEHQGKPFFQELVSYITSGPVVTMVIEGDGVVQLIRKMIGNTDPKESPPGTIRGDMALSKSENAIHASDSPEKALREMSIFFTEKELLQ